MQKNKENLYDVLGVEKSADKQSIKNGYRRMAKKHHPDKGGDTEQFSLVKLAHDILTDDVRKAKYDSTGDDSEKNPDNAHSTSINIIAGAFNSILQECANLGRSPLEVDMVGAVRERILATLVEPRKQVRILKVMLDMDKKMEGRFKPAKGSRENIFEGIVRNRILSLEINIKNFEEQIASVEIALELLNGITYKRDTPEPAMNGIPFHVSFSSF